jgi:hypothetical protein
MQADEMSAKLALQAMIDNVLEGQGEAHAGSDEKEVSSAI